MRRNKLYFSGVLLLVAACIAAASAYFYVAGFSADPSSKPETFGAARESDREQISYTQKNSDPQSTQADFDSITKKYSGVIAAVEKGYKALQSPIDLSDYDITADELHEVVRYLGTDHGYYYVKGAYNYSVRGNRVENYRPEYFLTAQELERIDSQIEEAASGVVKEAAKYKTDIEKLICIHDYLVTNITYGAENGDRENNLYGALVLKNTLCTGYSEAFSLIASKAGIESRVVTSKELNHAWNIVLLDGRYYFVDCSWDDPVIGNPSLTSNPVSGYGRYQYFMCSEEYLYNNDHQSKDWEVHGHNVSGLATSKFYDDFFWRDHETLMKPAAGSWYQSYGYDAENVKPNQVKFSIDKITFSGNENYTLNTERTVYSCWKMGSSYYPVFYSTLQGYNGDIYYMRADGIYKLNAGGKFDGSGDTCVFKNPRKDNIYDFVIDGENDKFTVVYGKTMENDPSNATQISYKLSDHSF